MNDRAILAIAQEQEFTKACYKEFAETSVVKSNMHKVKLYLNLSYFPNAISLITASFGVFYLLSSYRLPIQVVLGILLVIVAGGLEFAKRGLMNVTGRDYFFKQSLSPFKPLAIALLMAISMAVSFYGGDKLVTATATPPVMAINPEIAAIRQSIQDERTIIEGLRKTTWKGKITRDAVKGINKAQDRIQTYLARIEKLEAQDAATHAPIAAAFEARIIHFGFVLGGIAALADIALLFLLMNVKRFKHEVILLARQKGFDRALQAEEASEQFIAATTPSPAPQKRTAEPNGIINRMPPIGFVIPQAAPNTAMKPPEPVQPQAISETLSTETTPDPAMRDDRHASSSQQEEETAPFPESDDRHGPGIQKLTYKGIHYLHDVEHKRKTCLRCGAWFTYKNAHKRYCNENCRIEAYHRHRRMKTQEGDVTEETAIE